MSRRQDVSVALGVMQGRLSTQTPFGYQAFPQQSWRREFDLASERSLHHIEWVLDSRNVRDNPLLSDPQSIVNAQADTGVKVITVCADYLMDSPLDPAEPESWTLLTEVLSSMQKVGAGTLVIPLVDQSSLLDPQSRRRFERSVPQLEAAISSTQITVSLEADLTPQAFRQLLTHFSGDRVGINYDIGNSAALGYNFADEFENYFEWINLVHIKDRKLRGPSVPLGTGSAQVRTVMQNLLDRSFHGPYTLQAYRDSEGLAVFDEQLALIRKIIDEAQK